MAALNGFSTTSIAETIPTESINQLTIPPANHVRIYEQLAWIAPAKGGKHVWPQLDPVAVSGTQTEGDEFSDTAFSTSKEEVSMATVGVFSLHTDQVDAQGTSLSPEARVFAMAEETRNRIDKDVLALFGGAGYSIDNSGSNLSLDLWDVAVATFLAQKPNQPRIAFVGSTNQYRDIVKSIRQSGNGGLLMGQGSDLFNGTARMGYKGSWNGIEFYVGNTTQADASNDSCGFLACPALGSSVDGQLHAGSGLGLALWQPLQIEAERYGRRKGTGYTVSVMYGASITADCNVLEVIFKKAA